VEREQTAVPHPPRDLLGREPAGSEIVGVQDRPLPRGAHRAASVDFSVLYLNNSTLAGHETMVVAHPATEQDAIATIVCRKRAESA
jgi:hypothetical protein